MIVDCLAKLVLLFQPLRSKAQTNHDWSHSFSCAWCLVHVFASSSDWLHYFVVIGQSNYFDFGLNTQLKTAVTREMGHEYF